MLLTMQGAALWARLSTSHGYLNKQGYCDGSNTLGSPSGNCHQFPVIWGETGTRLHCERVDTNHKVTEAAQSMLLPVFTCHLGESNMRVTVRPSSVLLHWTGC